MASTTPTEPGWYPDPWGTGGERRYDGTAWGRETRPGPGAPAPTGAPSATPAAAVGDPTATSTRGPDTTGTAPTGDLPPAAWYPDPAGSGGLRYWDGTAWTSHTAYTDAPAAPAPRPIVIEDPAKVLESERSIGRTLRVLLLFAGPAIAVQLTTMAMYMHQFAPAFRKALEDPNGTNAFDFDVQQSVILSALSNIAGLLVMATGLLFIIWLGTAGKVAAAKGLPLRRSPWLGALSFAIPIVQYWWPYRATKDLLAADSADRVLVKRWWTLWIATLVFQFVGIWVVLLGVPDLVAAAVIGIGAAVAIAAAFAARSVIAAVDRSHEALVGTPAQA